MFCFPPLESGECFRVSPPWSNVEITLISSLGLCKDIVNFSHLSRRDAAGHGLGKVNELRNTSSNVDLLPTANLFVVASMILEYSRHPQSTSIVYAVDFLTTGESSNGSWTPSCLLHAELEQRSKK